jgi:hypothetical protein
LTTIADICCAYFHAATNGSMAYYNKIEGTSIDISFCFYLFSSSTIELPWPVQGDMNAGKTASIFYSGPFEAEELNAFLSRRAGSSGVSCRILSLVKKTLHRHRAGFETQRASPFRNRVKAPQNTQEKPPEHERWPLSLRYPLHCWWCWRVLPAAICNRYAAQTTTP